MPTLSFQSRNEIKRAGSQGISLLETLIALGLMGVLMLPMLFMSSAFFTNQLNRTRQSMEVSYNASLFLNRFLTDLYYSQKVLASVTDTGGTTYTSDANQLYYSYLDPTTQQNVKAGYKLVTSGSNKYLQKLAYNTTTGNWDAISPYSTTDANQLLLPSTAVFTYCIDSVASCTAASSPDKALLVRLSGWQFTKTNGSQPMTLPTAVDAYVGAGVIGSGGGGLLSEQPKVIYEFPGSNFGSSANLQSFALDPSSGMLNGLYVSGGGSGGTLTTILTGMSYPNEFDYETPPGRTIDSTGRVYLWDYNGKVWTWASSTGLSTIITGRNNPGASGSHIMSTDNYFGFGEQNSPGNFYIYSPSSGLSTILTNKDRVGVDQSITAGPDGRIYMGSYDAAATGAFWTWKSSTGLTQLVSGFLAPGPGSVAATTGMVAFGEHNGAPGKFWVWQDTGGAGKLSILQSSVYHPGSWNSTYVAGDGRVFWGSETTSASYMWSWKDGDTLTTMLSSSSTAKPGNLATGKAASDGTFVFAEQSATGKIWAWKRNSFLSVLVSSAYGGADEGGIVVDSTGRFFFGDQASSSSKLWSWSASTGLSTLVSSGNSNGAQGSIAVASDDSVYWGGQGTNMYRWSQSDGLSVIATSSNKIGYGSTKALPNNGVVFGENDGAAGTGKFYTWTKSGGLSVIVSGAKSPGFRDTDVGSDGTVTFGEYVSPGKFWVWKGASPTYSIGVLNSQGSSVGSSYSMGSLTNSYTASDRDSAGNIYYLDATNKQLRVYSYSGGAYSQSSSFSWSTWATSVGGIAVDENDTSIALLDKGSKAIDIYSNRFASGTPSAPSTFSISSQTTTPTGLEISNRTGNFLVLDSTISGSGASATIKLYVYAASNATSPHAYLKSYTLPIGTFTTSAATETDFRVSLDNSSNVLYIIAPTVGQVYALSMPDYL